MLSTDPTTIARERNLADRALELFCSVYGLGWNDSFVAATFEREQGRERADRVLSLISQSGCSFADAVATVDQVDSYYRLAA